MTKIILASNSPQRKKLLKHLVRQFSIRPSQVDEIKNIQTTVENLVKENARLKAQDVASRLKKGIVIGADTLVLSGQGKLIGKPKDLKQAKENLKLLMHKPSWVYTGVAVIDAATKKMLVDYEKTKIYMNPLSDGEIDRYHTIVSPLDKAGGFDIEGKGSLFIRRIEGCYYNVIGLPLAKLCEMLKKFWVRILMVLLMFYGSGCTTEYNLATEKQETLLYGTDKENSIGAAMAHDFEKQIKLDTDVDINERVQKILKRIVEICDRKELVYSIKVIDEDKLNAMSLPGGYVYIYKGLVDAVKSDDELAGVIGHEVGHITAKHAMKRLQNIYGYTILQIAALQTHSGGFAGGVGLAATAIFTEFSQSDEYEADRLGLKYMRKAGYNPQAMKTMLSKLYEKEVKEPAQPYSYWRTHPYLPQRIAAVNKETGQMEFRDYLNLTGERSGF